MIGLTEKQRRCYDFIASRIHATGIAPTVAEMADELGYQTKGRVHEILVSLEDRGHIRRLPRKARAIEIVHESAPLATTADVRLKPEIFLLVRTYTREHGISLETAVNELLRAALEAA